MKRMLWSSLLHLLALSALAQDSLQQAIAQKVEGNTKTYPVLWQQTAAEYRALCYQAFNLAALRLKQVPKKKGRKVKYAIITDLDETILDNSYSEAQLLKEGKFYSDTSWKQWVNTSAATALPGAVKFLQAASKKGFTIFYISNRNMADIPCTLRNLKILELPNADTAHFLFMSNTSSKESRRQQVATKYTIVMLLGDNLTDFTSAFEKKSISERFAETDAAKEEWGKKFIVLPNSTYGEWENALYNYQHNLSPMQKQAIRSYLLKGYKN
jgi:5'-nucleotidase (lipoprotein e(P4) family)